MPTQHLEKPCSQDIYHQTLPYYHRVATISSRFPVLGEKSSCPWMSQDKIYDTSLKSRNKGATNKEARRE